MQFNKYLSGRGREVEREREQSSKGSFENSADTANVAACVAVDVVAALVGQL